MDSKYINSLWIRSTCINAIIKKKSFTGTSFQGEDCPYDPVIITVIIYLPCLASKTFPFGNSIDVGSFYNKFINNLCIFIPAAKCAPNHTYIPIQNIKRYYASVTLTCTSIDIYFMIVQKDLHRHCTCFPIP